MGRLAVGTAQWGMPYGIANRVGVPSDRALSDLVAACLELDVSTLDTARAYGQSEERIGRLSASIEAAASLRIVTKVSPRLLDGVPDRASAVERLRSSVAVSRHHLHPATIDTLLFHRGAHLSAFGGYLWDELRSMRERGALARIGVSAATPDEAMLALEGYDVDVIQCAGSLLDQRLARSGFFDHARALGVEVHLRSVFLQGVAFLPVAELSAHLSPCFDTLQSINEFSAARRVSAADVWFDYARSLPVDRLVVGLESALQLRQNEARLSSPPSDEVARLAAAIPPLPAETISPAQWAGD